METIMPNVSKAFIGCTERCPRRLVNKLILLFTSIIILVVASLTIISYQMLQKESVNNSIAEHNEQSSACQPEYGGLFGGNRATVACRKSGTTNYERHSCMNQRIMPPRCIWRIICASFIIPVMTWKPFTFTWSISTNIIPLRRRIIISRFEPGRHPAFRIAMVQGSDGRAA